MMNLVDSVLPAPLSPLGGGERGGGEERGGHEARFTTPGKRGESESVFPALPADSPNEDTLVLSHPPHAVKHLVGDGVDVGGEVPQLLPHVLLHHLRPVHARNELVRVHRGQDGADVSLRRGRGRQPMRGADHTATSSPASHPITPCSTSPLPTSTHPTSTTHIDFICSVPLVNVVQDGRLVEVPESGHVLHRAHSGLVHHCQAVRGERLLGTCVLLGAGQEAGSI